MTFVDHFNQVINSLGEKFRAQADGKTVINFFNEINRATLDAIALVINKEFKGFTDKRIRDFIY